MTQLEARLLSLSESATKFVSESGLPMPLFKPGSAWPDVNDLPCHRVLEDDLRLRITPDPLLRAIALRQVHDPDEQSLWVFVPVPALNQVWLVRTAKFDPSRN